MIFYIKKSRQFASESMFVKASLSLNESYFFFKTAKDFT